MVDNLNDWIVIVIRNWIVITSKIFWDENLLPLFELKDEHLFHQTDLSKHAFNVENIDETTNSKHKSYLNKLFLNDLPDYLVVELGLGRSVLVHLFTINFDICKDVNTFRFIKKTKSVLEILSSTDSCFLFSFLFFVHLILIYLSTSLFLEISSKIGTKTLHDVFTLLSRFSTFRLDSGIS